MHPGYIINDIIWIMKNVKVLLNDSEFVESLRRIFEPLRIEISEMTLDHRVADSDFFDTQMIILDPFLGEPGVATELIDTLKSRSATSFIPILLCSHEDNDMEIINGLNAGANDFILLPASERTLLRRINSLLNR